MGKRMAEWRLDARICELRQCTQEMLTLSPALPEWRNSRCCNRIPSEPWSLTRNTFVRPVQKKRQSTVISRCRWWSVRRGTWRKPGMYCACCAMTSSNGASMSSLITKTNAWYYRCSHVATDVAWFQYAGRLIGLIWSDLMIWSTVGRLTDGSQVVSAVEQERAKPEYPQRLWRLIDD